MDLMAYWELTANHPVETRDNWKTLCPVHSESTPSFFIHKQTYLCHCFGCGAKGYLDTILARALELEPSWVRKKLGIPVMSRFEDIAEKSDAVFSRAILAGYPKIKQHPYLEARGFTEETVTAFDTRWDSQYRRLVFPLWYLGVGPMGALARNIRQPMSILTKWESLWNTNKGGILYGRVKPSDGALVVEGLFDAMWLYQHGYTNVVCLLTSHPSKGQLKSLRDFNHLVSFLDNDKAGISGTTSLVNSLRGSTLVECVKYPNNKKDPFELTSDELHKALGHRLTYVEFAKNQ